VAAKIVALVLRLVVAGVFVAAGAMKIWDFKHGGSATSLFFEDVMNYHLTPWDVTMVIAVYLPWLEVVVGVALLTPWLRLGALSITAGLTVVFLGALGSAWWRGLDISCGCFGRGVSNATDFPVVMMRDVVLLGVIGFLWWRERRSACVSPALRIAGVPPA
jgi:uncharacterized membrane protein YphA (DoxX/SURF4 family)